MSIRLKKHHSAGRSLQIFTQKYPTHKVIIHTHLHVQKYTPSWWRACIGVLMIMNGLMVGVSNAQPSKTATSFYTKGRQLALAKKHSLALDFYDQAIALNPTYYEALRDRGAVRAQLGYYKEAIQDFSAAIVANPHDSALYNNRGAAYFAAGKHRHAMRDFKTCIAYQPDSGMPHTNYATAASKLGKENLALEHYRKAIEKDPDNRHAYHGYANSLVHLRLLNESIPFYDKALSLNPSDPAVHFNRAYALHLMGREAEAIINASKAVALKRNYKEAFYLRGQCLLAMKEGSAACKDWVQAAKMGHKESKKALSRYCK